MKLTWKERIFSLKEVDAAHRQLCVLGVRIKLRRNMQLHPRFAALPIEPHKIFFANVLTGYCCNPRYVLEELLRRHHGYELVWMVDRHILNYWDDLPRGVRLVMWGTEEALRECATAAVWVVNGWQLRFARLGVVKRPGQTYIQLWHGSLGFKKLVWKAAYPNRKTLRLLKHDIRQIDYIITNSDWEEQVFREAFGQNPRLCRLGHARNDIFFLPKNEQDSVRRKVYERLGVPTQTHLLLYAPTWREDGSCPKISRAEWQGIRQALTKRFGGEWTIAARWHPAHSEFLRYGLLQGEASAIVNASNYTDIQELLVASDAVLSDYSSCILDFLFTGRPGFLMVPDHDRYTSLRKLYYPLRESPFPVSSDCRRLIESILSFDSTEYAERVRRFLQQKGCMEDGRAAARAADFVEQLISSPSKSLPS